MESERLSQSIPLKPAPNVPTPTKQIVSCEEIGADVRLRRNLSFTHGGQTMSGTLENGGREGEHRTRHFGWYDNWKQAILICPQCWSGQIDSCRMGYSWLGRLSDYYCPNCGEMLAI